MRKNRIHTAEFRLKIVKERLRGISARALSSKWKLSTSLIRTWVDHHQSSGALGLSPKSHHCYTSEFKRSVVEAYTKEHRRIFLVEMMCRVLQVSNSGFYYWLKHPHGKRAAEQNTLLAEINEVY